MSSVTQNRFGGGRGTARPTNVPIERGAESYETPFWTERAMMF